MAQVTAPVPMMGVDRAIDRRPGVPKELDPPRPAGAAHWQAPERQRDPGHVLRRRELAELTPVFGTTVPPRRLSGLMRRAAYRLAEHRTSHWMVLLLADRVDALEHRTLRMLPYAAVAIPIVAGAFFLANRRPRSRSR